MNLNFLYKQIKNDCETVKEKHTPQVKAVILHGIYKSAYEYVKNGGRRDLDKILGGIKK